MSSDPGICAKLRTKTMYLNVEWRHEPDEPGCSNSAVFWCLKTMEVLGPDDLPANPDACRAGRACAVLHAPPPQA